MGTIVTLRPNGVIGGGGAWNNVGGAATLWNALSDSANTTYITSQSLNSPYTVSMGTSTISPKAVKRWRVGAVVTMTGANALVKVNADFGSGAGFWTAAFSGPSSANQTRYGPWIDGSPSQAQIDGLTMYVNDRSGAAGNQQIKEIFVELELVAAPTTTVTGPAEGGTIAAGRPTVAWTFAQTDAEPQYTTQITVVPSAIYSAGGFDINAEFADFDNFSSELIAGGGLAQWAFSTDSSWTPDSDVYPLLPPGTYRAYVRTGIAVGGGILWSTIDSNTFSVAYNVPAAPTTVLVAANVSGPGVTISGPAFGANNATSTATIRLQRSEDGGLTWRDAVNGYIDSTQVAFGSAWSTTYRDREATAGVSTKYRAQILTKDTANSVWVASAWSTVLTNTLSLIDAATVGWTFWKFVKTVAGWLGGDITGFYYERGTFTLCDVLVAGEPHTFSQAPAEQLVATPLGRTRAVVVSSPLAGDEGQLSFLIDLALNASGTLIETTYTESELLDLLTAQNVLVRKPGLRTRWIAWTGERSWDYVEETKEVSASFTETDPPIRTEG